MLTLEQILAHRTSLAALLPGLKKGKYAALEYGAPFFPKASHIRVTYIPTAGGSKFRTCLMAGGCEGSGQYSESREETSVLAMELVFQYHLPSGLPLTIDRMRKFKLELGLPYPEERDLEWMIIVPRDVHDTLGDVTKNPTYYSDVPPGIQD